MSTKVKTPFIFKNNTASHTNLLIHGASKLFSKLKSWQKIHQQNRDDRVAIKALLDLNNNNLKDIGISRSDVIWASKLPRDKIATLELQRIAKANHN